MKQETLEEAAENFWLNDDTMSDNDRVCYVKGFTNGAKYQQERSYSEEEVLGILVKAMKDVKIEQLTFFDGGSEYPIYSNLSNWFEQFKNK